jgi:hypothetical protein
MKQSDTRKLALMITIPIYIIATVVIVALYVKMGNIENCYIALLPLAVSAFVCLLNVDNQKK